MQTKQERERTKEEGRRTEVEIKKIEARQRKLSVHGKDCNGCCMCVMNLKLRALGWCSRG